ncbi:hypothetical protein [Pedobacter sp. UBA5917]|jgi:hypothetical protein|uniref:hypothetical protein n=1 Tax=Pedobacter sp. UBA5917 TaxID=1947061 RepID=UPI0025F34E8A|nr:hypothetical protein [Pedobacter sp. UBA5917]
MYLNIISTATKIGENRLNTLLPMLNCLPIDYQVIYNNVTEIGYDALTARVKLLVKQNYDNDFFIFGEDDLILTDFFCIEVLDAFINECLIREAGVLFTGSHHVYGVKKTNIKGLVKLNGGRGCQLVVVFKPMYDLILGIDNKNHIDSVLSAFGVYADLYLTIPFLSKQMPDADSLINKFKNKKVGELFNCAEQQLMKLISNES